MDLHITCLPILHALITILHPYHFIVYFDISFVLVLSFRGYWYVYHNIISSYKGRRATRWSANKKNQFTILIYFLHLVLGTHTQPLKLFVLNLLSKQERRGSSESQVIAVPFEKGQENAKFLGCIYSCSQLQKNRAQNTKQKTAYHDLRHTRWADLPR